MNYIKEEVMARAYKAHLNKLISKYRIMVGNLVYDSEEQRVHEHVEMILEEMKKDKDKYEKSIRDSK